MIKHIFIVFLGLMLACNSDNGPETIIIGGGSTNEFSFQETLIELEEGETATVVIGLSFPAKSDGSALLQISSDNSVEGLDYSSNPTSSSDLIALDIVKGAETVEFEFTALKDNEYDNESVFIEIIDVPEGIEAGTNSILQIDIIDYQVGVEINGSSKQLLEGESTVVDLDFSKQTNSAGEIKIATNEISGVYGEDYTTVPSVVNDSITLAFNANATGISFTVNGLTDGDNQTEIIEFSIGSGSDFLQFDKTDKITISIIEDLDPAQTLTVATWNIEHYPKNGNTTINAVKDIIMDMNVDIIALQEIDDIAAFNTLVSELSGWEGKLYDVRGGIELAYLYKTAEISSFSDLSVIYNDDSNAFPRQPVIATAQHTNGLEVTIFNVHLKCCGLAGSDEANRREAASIALQEYIDTNMPNDNVIVLGDWNDDISDGPFDNFLSDSDNYVFADFDIGNGSSANWSYPSWPSHLDHILITNELFDNHVSTETLKLDQTTSNYNANVSDHRPVVVHLVN